MGSTLEVRARRFSVKWVFVAFSLVIAMSIIFMLPAQQAFAAETTAENQTGTESSSSAAVSTTQGATTYKLSKKEKKASKVIKNFYKYAKTYNVKKMSKCFAKKSKKSLFPNQACVRKIFKKQNKKKLSIQFTSASVKKKKATFKVKVNYRSGKAAFRKAIRKFFDATILYSFEHGKDPSEKWFSKKFNKLIKRYATPSKFSDTSRVVTIKLKKQKSTWKIAKATRSLKDSVCCDFYSAAKAAEKDVIKEYTQEESQEESQDDLVFI
jgi:hypothetical protein